MHITRVTEEKKEGENLFEETMTENFFNLRKKTEVQFQKAQRLPNEPKETHTKIHYN